MASTDAVGVHSGSCQGYPAIHSAGDGGRSRCPCCTVPPTCTICSTIFVKVIIKGAISGITLCRFNMRRDHTVADLMRKTSTTLKTKKIQLKLICDSIHGSIVLDNKFMHMWELIKPSKTNICLLMAKITPPPCENCGEEDGALLAGGSPVSLKFCQGCYSAVYCSGDCQRRAWPSHKSICRRQYQI